MTVEFQPHDSDWDQPPPPPHQVNLKQSIANFLLSGGKIRHVPSSGTWQLSTFQRTFTSDTNPPPLSWKEILARMPCPGFYFQILNTLEHKILQLFYVDGLKHWEISRKLSGGRNSKTANSYKESAIRTRLHRIKLKLRNAYIISEEGKASKKVLKPQFFGPINTKIFMEVPNDTTAHQKAEGTHSDALW